MEPAMPAARPAPVPAAAPAALAARAPRPPRAEAPARPPKAPPPRKAAHAGECERLEQLPNIGPSIAADLRSLGIVHPRELAARDALQLYQQLCRHTARRQDPCVLDTFMAAVDFMRGAEARPWWSYTAERKQRFGVV